MSKSPRTKEKAYVMHTKGHSYMKISKALKVHEGTIVAWSRKYEWNQRDAELKAATRVKLQEKVSDYRTRRAGEIEDLILAGLPGLLDQMAKGKMNSTDLEKFQKLLFLVRGESTENIRVNAMEKVDKAYEALVKKVKEEK